VKLAEGVFLVGGGAFTGFGLSPGKDCHIYVIQSGNQSAMVDCGMGTSQSVTSILANIRDDGLEPNEIGSLFVTHYHADHAGGAAVWRRLLDVRVLASTAGVAAMETADDEATGLALERSVGLLPSDYRVDPCKVDDPLADGEIRAFGDATITAIHSPGHSAADVSFLFSTPERKYLFTGDTVFYLGLVRFQNNPDFDFRQLGRSIHRLADLEVDGLLPGHGALCLRGARDHLRAASRSFSGTYVPNELPRPPHQLDSSV
jgi:glyoxylase-like metal-dependent hydrolase (beta-lactamase superfamily II)